MLLGVKQDLALLEEGKKKLDPCVKGRRGVGNHHGVLVGKGAGMAVRGEPERVNDAGAGDG